MRFTIPSDLSTVLHAGFLRSVASLGIKVATAGLTYLTYVVLSRTMTPDEYGHFAFGLALATVLAIAAGIGQPMAILRLWSQETVAGRNDKAIEAVQAGSMLTILAGIIIAFALCAVVFVTAQIVTFSDTVNHFYGAAFLVLPMAMAEYQSSALRAQGSLWTALVPRDILWRVALPAAVLGLFGAGVVLSGPDALVLSAALLSGMLVLQLWRAMRSRYVLTPKWAPLRGYWAQWGGFSRWLMLGALIETAALNADIILVGLMLDLESSGLYFNAFRTAGLMTLISYAIVLVIAPMITRAFYAKEMRKAQLLATASVWVGFSFALMVFLAFVLFGVPILALFGPTYDDGQLILELLAIGLLVDAATGPSRTLMMTTGHERTYVYALGAITLVGFVVQVLVLPFYGMIGLALVNMITRLVSQAFMAIWCIVYIKIDPTIFGILRLRRQPVA